MTIQEDLILLAQIKKQLTDLERSKELVEGHLADGLRSVGQRTTTASGLRGTLVEGSTVVIDTDSLKGALRAAQWKKITKPVIDKEMLEACMASGVVDPNIVAAHSKEKPSKPYIRVTGTLEVPETPPQAARKVRPRKGA